MFQQSLESSFCGVRLSDRVRQAVPVGVTVNGDSLAAVRAEWVPRYLQF